MLLPSCQFISYVIFISVPAESDSGKRNMVPNDVRKNEQVIVKETDFLYWLQGYLQGY